MWVYLETFYTVMEHFQIKEKNFVYHKIQLFIFIAYFSVENISQLHNNDFFFFECDTESYKKKFNLLKLPERSREKSLVMYMCKAKKSYA